MKLLKVLTIVLFSLFLSFSVLSAQENNTTDTGVSNQQPDGNTGTVPGSEIEKTVPDEIKTETVSAEKKKTPVIEKKTEVQKTVSKKTPEKKSAVENTDVKEEETVQVKMDGDLLLINEGNFKYKRIPDIKLTDIKPEAADSGIQAAVPPENEQEKSTGFLGLSKTASDVIVKGGVLLLILLIFVLYKSRMSGPGNKSSKKRNVLNSYRK
jgi:outer membrane biosynthesis protein TonB